ncbi:MAG: hypothetical protein OYH76_19195 [Defluviicoccus sp.]|nr:hypothetical protein [Defluviicoccus sp.]MDE0278027.1 hypothetical protein [Defluviicoccus sp.]
MKKLWWGLAGASAWAHAAFAQSLGDMAKSAEGDLDLVGGFLAIVFYLLGILVVAFGLFRIKKHMDQPQQVSLSSAIVAIMIGAAIILIPVVLNGIAETFGLTTGSTGIGKPKF